MADHESRLQRLKALPWLALAQASVVAAEHWRGLSAKDRGRLLELLRASHGRPAHLSGGERAELRRLVGKLDLPGLGRSMMPVARGARRARR